MDEELQKLRHSLAHLLAAAVLELWPSAKPAIGPPVEDGFYYDFDFENPISEKDLSKIEAKMREILKSWDKFEKIEVSPQEAKERFKDNPYKLEIIEELAKKGEKITLYKSGNFVDLCKGGHIETAKKIDPLAFKLDRIAGAYWKGDSKNKMLTRIYGLAFKSKEDLEKYLKLREERIKRDHRKLGKVLDLFSFHEISPGAPFWHPKGMVIFRELESWWLKKHKDLGYLEISTPIMVKKELFEKSGHWDYYRENMFTLEVEGETFVLKPMNCPEATIVYSSKVRSYRDLPLRLAEIGRLHRNELSGTLAGLFRVRQITMDDAHLFVREDQIFEEIFKVLALIEEFYQTFNLPLKFKLATKPDKAMGREELWEKAEESLEKALKEKKVSFELKPKDGAFYGPKIDVHIKDSLEREWQVATVQLDFQMPERFDLFYIDKDGKKKRPVMIHRAIFGSFERFIGILTEHFGGAFPIWLAPEQVWILPVGERNLKYAQKVEKLLQKEKIRAKVEERETISKRILEGENQKIPYLLVVGEREEKTESVRVRKRKEGDLGEMEIEKFISKIKEEIAKKAIN